MPPTSTSPNTPSSQRDRFVLTGTSGGIRRWRGPLVAVVTLTLCHLPQPGASPRYRICCRSPRKIPRLNVIHFFSSTEFHSAPFKFSKFEFRTSNSRLLIFTRFHYRRQALMQPLAISQRQFIRPVIRSQHQDIPRRIQNRRAHFGALQILSPAKPFKS